MFKVKIPVYYNTDTSTQKKSLGLPVNEEDLTIREIVFYNIDVLEPHVNNDNEIEGTDIIVGGIEYQSPFELEYIEKLIEDGSNTKRI